MKSKKIILAGGTGFIGQELIRYFGKDNEIIVLSRQIGTVSNNSYHQKSLTAGDGYNIRYVQWNGRDVIPAWSHELDGADLVINLSGKSVNCRYHRRQRKEIIDSRINATKAIATAIRMAHRPPTLWINAASSTIYRHTLDTPNDESTGVISVRKQDNMPYNFIDHLRTQKNRLKASFSNKEADKTYNDPGIDFSIAVCQCWEKAFFEENTPGTRKIAMRTAITLGRGGVIIPYLNLCKYGLGGKHGNGRQLFSWVHSTDVCRMIAWFFANEKTEGIYNCVAPNAVSNYSFMKTLRQVIGYKIGLPAPTWLLEAGAFLIGTETELMLKSRWVIPKRALEEGFAFEYPLLKPAIEEIISNLPRRKYHLL